jgi:hypothetical protein
VAPTLQVSGTQRDVVELLVVQGGSTKDLTLYQDNILLATLPAVSVRTGDLIVLHLSPSSAIGDAPGSEFLSKSEHPASTYASNYDGAWDFHGNSGAFINYNNNLVLRVKDPAGNTQDGVAFARSAASTIGYPPLLQALQAEGAWLPSDCGGALCTYTTSSPTAYAVSANWAGLGSTTSRLQTAYRSGNTDSNTAGEWAVTVTAGTLGQLNP